MKKVKFLLAMVAAVALFGGMGAVKANTAATIASGATNSSITIERKVTGATGPVTNTFTYTITETSKPTGATTTGVPTGTKTIAMTAQALSSGTATKTVDLSFVNATFSKPGDYVYTITETASSDSTTYPRDTANSYTVKVSVRNHTASDFTTAMDATILLYSGTGSSITKITTGKAAFTSAASYKSITVTKTVEGTMADTDASFPITVTIKGGIAGDVYSITGGTSATGCTVASSATSCSVTVSLKHNQMATITGIRNGQTYSIAETANTTTNNYQTFINGSTTNSKSTSSDLTVGASNSNTIVNKWNQDPLTGFATRILPYILIVLIAVGAITYVAIKNSKNKKTDLEA